MRKKSQDALPQESDVMDLPKLAGSSNDPLAGCRQATNLPRYRLVNYLIPTSSLVPSVYGFLPAAGYGPFPRL
jgi:hypothetical protein